MLKLLSLIAFFVYTYKYIYRKLFVKMKLVATEKYDKYGEISLSAHM